MLALLTCDYKSISTIKQDVSVDICDVSIDLHLYLNWMMYFYNPLITEVANTRYAKK